MTFLIDVNLSPVWVGFLLHNGITAIHWSAVGDSKAPDAHLMQYASDRSMVLITQDMDYGMHLAIGGMAKPSVVLLRTRYAGPEVAGQLLLDAIRHRMHDLLAGAIITVDDESSRIKLLPIKQR